MLFECFHPALDFGGKSWLVLMDRWLEGDVLLDSWWLRKDGEGRFGLADKVEAGNARSFGLLRDASEVRHFTRLNQKDQN